MVYQKHTELEQYNIVNIVLSIISILIMFVTVTVLIDALNLLVAKKNVGSCDMEIIKPIINPTINYDTFDLYGLLQLEDEIYHSDCAMITINKQTLVDNFETLFFKIFSSSDIARAIQISEDTPLNLQTAIEIVKYSNKFDLEISLILGLIELESNFKQYEVGASQDRGYMQIIPSTEKWLFDEYGALLEFDYDPSKIFEADYNIGLGSLYLYHLKERYGRDKDRILSEYNRGPYNLRKYYARYLTYETIYSKTVKARSQKYLAYN